MRSAFQLYTAKRVSGHCRWVSFCDGITNCHRYSIGSNDLTQLILGVDRNSEIVSSVFDERNEAIKHAIKLVVEAANQRGKYIGICGQAPSDFPDFASFLVDIGIKSMSLNSDTVLSTIYKIAETEKKHQ